MTARAVVAFLAYAAVGALLGLVLSLAAFSTILDAALVAATR